MATNGRLAASALAPIPGSGPYGAPKLRKDAAAAYNALHREAMRRWGISMALSEGAVGRAYRSYDRQVLAKRVYGGNAATPGTSNHGWGLAVDLVTRQQRWVVDQIGAKYGYSKRWSDASWEWWHLKWRPGNYPAVRRAVFRALRYGHSGRRVRWVQRQLRRRGFVSVPRSGRRGHGYFGASTRSAVIRFQRARGLRADGVVGPATWRALAR